MLDRILKTAAGEIGYREGEDNDTKYGIEFGLNNQPWCVMFLWWCFKHSGAGELFPNSAHCDGVRSYAKGIGRWLNRAELEGTAGLKTGDLIIWDYDYDGSGDHIGIIESVSGSSFVTIEGNYADGVCRVNRNLDCVSGAYRPAYGESEEETDEDLTESGDEKPAEEIEFPILRKGMWGNFVYLLQAKLEVHGYTVWGVDGDFGSLTEKALKDFQKDNGLEADGFCGALTWEALRKGGV